LICAPNSPIEDPRSKQLNRPLKPFIIFLALAPIHEHESVAGNGNVFIFLRDLLTPLFMWNCLESPPSDLSHSHVALLQSQQPPLSLLLQPWFDRTSFHDPKINRRSLSSKYCNHSARFFAVVPQDEFSWTAIHERKLSALYPSTLMLTPRTRNCAPVLCLLTPRLSPRPSLSTPPFQAQVFSSAISVEFSLSGSPRFAPPSFSSIRCMARSSLISTRSFGAFVLRRVF